MSQESNTVDKATVLLICPNTNTVLGCQNTINEATTAASLAECFKNTIQSGFAEHIEGSFSFIINSGSSSTSCHVEGKQNLIIDGIGAHAEGYRNQVVSSDASNPTLACHVEGWNNAIQGGDGNHAEGFENTITTGSSNHIEGLYNNIISGDGNHAGGTGNTVLSGIATSIEGANNVVTSVGNIPGDGVSENCHIEGFNNQIGGFQNHVEGCNSVVNGFQSHVVGCNHQVDNARAGQNLSGYGGYFLYDPSKSFGADIYNYSNQLGGGLNPRNLYPGEGISMIDKTLANGVYPIGQHQAYRNTSDGLSYSVVLKGELGLTDGVFVTFSNCRDNDYIHEQRPITMARCSDEVIGVITHSSGFIANAGQFPASTRIQYDVYRNPIIQTNYVTGKDATVCSSCHNQPKSEPSTQQIISFPGFQTILRTDINRAVPFIPHTERPGYYQVAISGLVVVQAENAHKIGSKCDVRCGIAVRGKTFWVAKIIDDSHILILLK